MDRRGPAKIVLVGIMLIAAGLGTFAFGVARQADYLPILPTGLAIMGMGMGCSMMPLSGAAVQTLAPHQIARGSTLISVNQQVGGSIGTALMSVLLTYQFNHSEIIATAKKVALTPESGAGRGRRLTLPRYRAKPTSRPNCCMTFARLRGGIRDSDRASGLDADPRGIPAETAG